METLVVIPKEGEGILEAIERTIQEKGGAKHIKCPYQVQLESALKKIDELENQLQAQEIISYTLARIFKAAFEGEENSKKEVQTEQ